MMRNRLRLLGIAIAVLALSTSGALAKKGKKGGGGSDAGGGGGMTFEPETVERKDPPAAEPTKAAPAATAKKKRVVPVGDPNAKPGVASKTLERALKLYESGDYYTASIELNKVVEGQSNDDAANKQRAEFYMGKALFNLRFYSASLSYFDRIVQAGAEHRYYTKTLQWLASLSQHLPESAGVLEKIGKYTRADLDQPALEPLRDQLYYLLGRFHYSQGNFKDALELFSAVPERSHEYFPKAKFFEGITHVRENRGKDAADSFKSILRLVKSYKDPDKVPKILRDYEDLANISLGRIFYTTKQFQQSIKYYEKLPQSSPDWVPSLFEAAWAYFQVDGDSKALGNIHTINSPFFEKEFYPESYILKAVIYFNRCNYDRSAEAIAEFNAIYPDLRQDIEKIIAKYPDNAAFYDYVVKIKNGDAELNERAQRAAEGALYDRTLEKSIDYVTELDRELKALEKADPSWKSTAVAGNILQDLTLQKSLAAGEAGQLARQRLQRLATEIQELVKQAIKVEYQTLEAEKGRLTSGLASEQGQSVNPNSKNYNNIVIDDEHQQWPFKGEYWKDELGYYRFKVANKCGR